MCTMLCSEKICQTACNQHLCRTDRFLPLEDVDLKPKANGSIGSLDDAPFYIQLTHSYSCSGKKGTVLINFPSTFFTEFSSFEYTTYIRVGKKRGWKIERYFLIGLRDCHLSMYHRSTFLRFLHRILSTVLCVSALKVLLLESPESFGFEKLRHHSGKVQYFQGWNGIFQALQILTVIFLVPF